MNPEFPHQRRPRLGPRSVRALVAAAVTALAVTVSGLAGTLTASASADPAATPAIARARLEGSFLLAGRVTVAINVAGEHQGQTIKRSWEFVPLCAAGGCRQVRLTRQRASGSDTLILNRRQPGYYAGSSKFFAPLRCNGGLWPKGSVVPFTITVRITAASIIGGVRRATRIDATYTNPERINRTPCVAFLGHDAARYHGHVVLPARGSQTRPDRAMSTSGG